MRRLLPWSLVMLAALSGVPAAAVSLAQVDDFQTGTLLNWGGGATPINVATDGPAGSGDRYLEFDAVNRPLGTYNSIQWAGDYLSAGVDSLRFDVRNAGPDPVALRINVFGPQNITAFVSKNPIVLAAGGGWVSVEFALTEAELTRKAGTATYAQTLSSVARLLIRHDPDPISRPGEIDPVTATIGIDNVTAVPEPDSALLLAVGLAAFARVRTANAPRAPRSRAPAALRSRARARART